MKPGNNRLAQQTSPYLLQHATNPVAWQPWDATALEWARQADKPILLSIGYSACHWCHVMAHESFEDEETAALMNTLFVNIKVDREERPDLDKIYQTAHSMLSEGRGGGWPLTIFIAPDTRIPFFSGTYFPKEARYGMLPFKEVLRRIAAYYQEHKADIARLGEAVQANFARMGEHEGGGESQVITHAALDIARAQLAASFDSTYGGFGAAPKFPHSTHLGFLLRHWSATRAHGVADERSHEMVLHTLRGMARGGLFDHLGGGFFRYSTDERWMIPHFEKMLYDNGLLLSIYSEAALAFDDAELRQVAQATADWAITEMQAPEGGFYSSLDADSDGHEGAYYLWSAEDIKRLLEPTLYPLVASRYGLDHPPNFEGRWHLCVSAELESIANGNDIDSASVEQQLATAKARLYLERQQRIKPQRDNKQLVSWNALMIKGLADCGRALAEPRYIDAAARAIDFVRNQLWNGESLHGSYTNAQISSPAFADDYAYLMDALGTMLQTAWRRADLEFAIALADTLLAQFYDAERGGFFFTSHQHEALIHRPKDFADEAMPSANGVAAFALSRLGHLCGDIRYLDAAEKTIKAAWPAIMRLPYIHDSLLIAADEQLHPPRLIVVRSNDKKGLPGLQQFKPKRMLVIIPTDEVNLPGVLAQMVPTGDFTAYVCEGLSCSAPLTDPQAVREVLAG